MSIILAPLDKAVEYHDRKTPVGSKLRSDEWAKAVPVQIREVSQASAAVESARYLQTIQDGIGDILGHRRNELGGITDRSGLMRDLALMAEQEGLRPPEGDKRRGGIQDVGSVARTELIYQMQTGSAYGYANWAAGQDPDALDAYPAQELVRASESRVPRDWVARWAAAGAKVGWKGAVRSPHVALKSSPIWVALSRFERDYPPFDFNSGMWVEDVDREAAVRLGLLGAGERVQPQDKPFAEGWETSVQDLGPELRRSLQEAFPDTVQIDGDSAKWRAPAGTRSAADVPDSIAQKPKVDLSPTAEPKRFSTPEEGRLWANEAIHPLDQGFSDSEVEALKRAQSDTRPVNDPLWTGEEMPQELEVWSRQLSATIQRGPQLPRMEVLHYSDPKFWAEYKIGQVITMRGFTSTTLAPNPDVEAKFGRGAVVTFRVPAGKRAVYQDRIRGNPTYDYQAEVLFDAGTKIVIQSKSQIGGVWHIVADMV